MADVVAGVRHGPSARCRRAPQLPPCRGPRAAPGFQRDVDALDMLARVREVTDDVEVGMLIYNAGADSVIRDFHDRDLNDAERMIGLNVLGPTRLAHHFGTGMRRGARVRLNKPTATEPSSSGFASTNSSSLLRTMRPCLPSGS